MQRPGCNKTNSNQLVNDGCHACSPGPLHYLSKRVTLSDLKAWVLTSNSVLCESSYFSDLDKRVNSGVIIYLIGEEFIPLYGNASAALDEVKDSLFSVFDYDHPLMVRRALEWIGIRYFQTCKGRPACDVVNYMHVLTTLITLHEMYCGDEYRAVLDQEARA